ncbi:MAG: bifunctional phosphoribosylaminoimidazolecarboxamide formyltransferase/IMP cyclohydrolase [Thaumarchaeota archaeon]|nr:bifunctional phosphoribosylaminoimidazolecarboxamide formyltransferase/IMP cyclohydrolase [Nitrososphaerota archaeon]
MEYRSEIMKISETKPSSRQSGDLKIRTALLSTFDKTGLVPFAEKLAELDVMLIATGGTLATLEKAGLRATPLDKIGHFPEMLDGRVKTLQPEIFAGILARKSSEEHMRQIREKGITTIDMVVCNFYAFESTASRREAQEDEVIEMIDIGGPSIVRASAKNYESVCVIPSPRFYEGIANELSSRKGSVSIESRRRLALAAFEIVAGYDIAIYNSLSSRFYPEKRFPDSFFLSANPFESPKYGENPDQKAMIYSISGAQGGLPEWKQIHGDVRSYNNYLDIAGAYEILSGFEIHPAAATVKHGQISGFAFSTSLADSYRLAHACDPEADFGNTTIVNRKVDAETAKLIGRNEGAKDDSVYTEIVLAPGYEPEALEILKQKQKKKIRIIETTHPSNYPLDLKIMQGLVLVQESPDYGKKLSESSATTETATKPTNSDVAILLGLWEVARRVESNAIVIGNGEVASRGKIERLWTLGVGTFRKRNGATKIALDNAGERARGAYCASDGFFPFPDSVELLGGAGIKAVIQRGGSVNDKKVVEAADKYSMSMLFTHARAFKH